MYCKQMKNMPMIATDWQMYSACPGCEWFKDGKCLDKRRRAYDDPCEFELTGGVLPLTMTGVTNTHIECAKEANM
jgi:hypothetical protein